MKKIKNKMILGIIIGISLTSTIVYAAYVQASDISFTSQTGLTSANVQNAIDEINEEVNTMKNTYLNTNDMGTPTHYIFDGSNKPTTSSPSTPPSGKNVYLGLWSDKQIGVCIKRNGTENCFRANNYKAEYKHIRDVFSDVSCSVTQNYIKCSASDFSCYVYPSGRVSCTEYSSGVAGGSCDANGDGTVSCS